MAAPRHPFEQTTLDRLKLLLRERGGVRPFEEAQGYTPGQISDLFRRKGGKRLSVNLLCRLAEQLGVPLTYFFEDKSGQDGGGPSRTREPDDWRSLDDYVAYVIDERIRAALKQTKKTGRRG
ncbi:MAG TPA: helix-turn-helix transcriptional regulator [Thermoanaerobaculia bacterium]|jgi:transcriptional regulator with XRE-family HTH domain